MELERRESDGSSEIHDGLEKESSERGGVEGDKKTRQGDGSFDIRFIKLPEIYPSRSMKNDNLSISFVVCMVIVLLSATLVCYESRSNPKNNWEEAGYVVSFENAVLLVSFRDEKILTLNNAIIDIFPQKCSYEAYTSEKENCIAEYTSVTGAKTWNYIDKKTNEILSLRF